MNGASLAFERKASAFAMRLTPRPSVRPSVCLWVERFPTPRNRLSFREETRGKSEPSRVRGANRRIQQQEEGGNKSPGIIFSPGRPPPVWRPHCARVGPVSLPTPEEDQVDPLQIGLRVSSIVLEACRDSRRWHAVVVGRRLSSECRPRTRTVRCTTTCAVAQVFRAAIGRCALWHSNGQFRANGAN